MKGSKIIGVFFAIAATLSTNWAYAFSQSSCPVMNSLSPADIMLRFKDRERYKQFYMVCGHRGMWYRYPENSAPAITDAIRLGIDCVENDVRMTSDNVLVVFHDKELNARLYDPATGKPATGTVAQTTWADLSKLRYLDRDSNKTNYPVLTLSEYLELTNDNIVVNHEDKTKNPEVVKAMLRMIVQRGRLSQSIIKGRFSYAEYKEIIKGIVDEEDVTFTPVIFEDTPGYDRIFEEYWAAGYRDYELVIQKPTSKLMPYVARVKAANGRLGQFDVLPETGRGSFWVGQWRDPAAGKAGYDYRSDWDFLINQSQADYIISDRPCLMIQYLEKLGLRRTQPSLDITKH